MKARTMLLSCLLLAVSAFVGEKTGSLKITLSNVKKSGKIHVAIYRDGEEFPSDKTMVKRMIIESSTCQFDGIPLGSYAVAVYQDVNGNGKLDKGMFGIPDEPFAFSNNFRPKFSGPTFEKCKFDFKEDNQAISIEMINSFFGGG